MAITKSAKKAIRNSKRKQVFNLRRKRKIEDSFKKVKKLISAGQPEEAKKALSEVYKALDKAAKMGTIKKNNASRRKSRISQLVKKSTK